MYQLVFPRDFFNHAKLLNCIGKFHLAMGLHNDTLPDGVEVEEPEEIRCVMLGTHHALGLAGYKVYIYEELLLLYVPYNAKEKFPLWFEYKVWSGRALDEEGNLTAEFISAIGVEGL